MKPRGGVFWGKRRLAASVALFLSALAFGAGAGGYHEKCGGMENARIDLKADRVGYQWMSFAAYEDSWWRKGTLHDYPAQFDREIRASFGGNPSCRKTGYASDLWWAQYQPGGRVGSTHTVCWDSNILKDAVKADPETAARQFETIVRQAMIYNPRQSWLVVHGDDPAAVADYKAGRVPQTVQAAEAVAAHYGLPTLNLAKAAAEGGPSAVGAAVSAFVADVLNAKDVPAKTVARKPGTPRAKGLNAQCHVVTYDDGAIRKIGAWRIGAKSPKPSYMSTLEPGAAGDRMEMEFRGTEVGLLDFSVAGGADYAYRIDGGEWNDLPAAGQALTERHLKLADRLAYSGSVSARSDADRHVVELKVVKPGAGCIVGLLLNGSTADEDAGAGRLPQTLADLDREYARLKPVAYRPPEGRHALLPKTMKRLREGPSLRIVCLGDSLISDTCKSKFELLLGRRYPNCKVTSVCSSRSSTGCWWYKDDNRVDGWVFSHGPDLLVIGGVSQRDDVESMRSVIRQCRAKRPELEILVMTPVFGQEGSRKMHAWNVGWDEDPDKAEHPFRRQVRDMCAEEKVAFFDINAPLRRYVLDSGMDMGYFHRDIVHSNVRGQTVLGRLIEAWFASVQGDDGGSGDGRSVPRGSGVSPLQVEFDLPYSKRRDAASPSETSSLSAQPRRVAVFVDGGSRGGGAVTWVRLAKYMQPAVDLKLIEGADVRGGALEGLDLLIMPGGHSGIQKKNLGPEGMEKVRDYIRRGGRYFGTCAGLSLAQADGGFLKLVPYRKRRPEIRAGDATLAFDVSERGAALLGIKAGRRNFCYHSGPQLELRPNPEKCEFRGEVIATFAGSVDQNGKGCPSLAGLPAAFYGDFGEGKVLVTSFHPEYFPFTWDFVAAGVSALTGVKTSFAFPRKNPRTVKVAFFAPVVAGRGDAEAALELSEDPDISMWPVTGSNIDEGWLELVDVVVLPGGDDGNSGHQVRARAEDFAAFAARGGKLVTYGEAGAKRAPKGTLTLPSAKGLSTAIKGLWRSAENGGSGVSPL